MSPALKFKATALGPVSKTVIWPVPFIQYCHSSAFGCQCVSRIAPGRSVMRAAAMVACRGCPRTLRASLSPSPKPSRLWPSPSTYCALKSRFAPAPENPPGRRMATMERRSSGQMPSPLPGGTAFRRDNNNEILAKGEAPTRQGNASWPAQLRLGASVQRSR